MTEPAHSAESLAAEIAALDAEIHRLMDRRKRLQTILEGPRVKPMLVVQRYGIPWGAPARSNDLAGAMRELRHIDDSAIGSAVGVKVGGALIKWTDETGDSP